MERFISRIQIPAGWNEGHGVADFQLGLGPCGRTVTELDIDYCEQGVFVSQTCEAEGEDAGEAHVFFYQFRHITGRITVTFTEYNS